MLLYQSILCVLVASLSFLRIHGIEICNSFVCMNFNESTGSLNTLVDQTTKIDVVAGAGETLPLLEFSLVGIDGDLKMNDLVNSKVQVKKTFGIQTTKVEFSWEDVRLFSVTEPTRTVAEATITMSIVLPFDSTLFEFEYSFTIKEGFDTRVGIWDVSVSFPSSIASDAKGKFNVSRQQQNNCTATIVRKHRSVDCSFLLVP